MNRKHRLLIGWESVQLNIYCSYLFFPFLLFLLLTKSRSKPLPHQSRFTMSGFQFGFQDLDSDSTPASGFQFGEALQDTDNSATKQLETEASGVVDEGFEAQGHSLEELVSSNPHFSRTCHI